MYDNRWRPVLGILALASVVATSSRAADAATIRLVALGDSITIGEFASKTDDPPRPIAFDAARGGTSYVSLIARHLAQSAPVILQNLGVNSAYAFTIWNQEIPRIPRDATIVTLFMGVNDESQIALNGRYENDGILFAPDIPYWRAMLDHVVRGLRNAAPNARLILANVPNLAFYPSNYQGAGALEPRVLSLLAKASNDMNEAVNHLYGSGIDVVDLRCDARLYAGNAFANAVHPNDRGYAVIAEDFIDVIDHPRSRIPMESCAPFSSPH